MRNLVKALVYSSAIAITMVATTQASHAQLLAVGNFGNPFQTQSLYSINSTTGTATLIGSTGLSQISGITWNGSNLLAYTVSADVYVINPNTGAAGILAALPSTQPEGDVSFFGGSLLQVNSLGQVNTVNTSTGALTPVVDLSTVGVDFSGLLATSSGTAALALNGTNPDTLTLFAGTSIIATVPTGTNATTVGALASDGIAVWMSDGSSLFSIDTSNGSASLIGAFGVAGVSGLAFIPTPATAALFGAVGLMAARRRR